MDVILLALGHMTRAVGISRLQRSIVSHTHMHLTHLLHTTHTVYRVSR